MLVDLTSVVLMKDVGQIISSANALKMSLKKATSTQVKSVIQTFNALPSVVQVLLILVPLTMPMMMFCAVSLQVRPV